ncbi:MAG: hypothetical protein FWC92_01900 [Defluviitaleaceae bacterium]|nr:hypothetical protein [Defluviitaleaceae bacterium]
MKRKIALLLALIMILSLIPAQTFAQDPARMGTVSDLVTSSTYRRQYEAAGGALMGNRVGWTHTSAPVGQVDVTSGASVVTEVTFYPGTPTGSRLFTNVSQNIFAAGETTARDLSALPYVAPFAPTVAAGFAPDTDHQSRSAVSATPIRTRTEDHHWSADNVWIHAGWVLRYVQNPAGAWVIDSWVENGVAYWRWDPVFVPLVFLTPSEMPLGITAFQLIGDRSVDPPTPSILAPVDTVTGVRYPISLDFPINRPSLFGGPSGSGIPHLNTNIRVGYGRVAEEVTVSVDLNRLIREGQRTQQGGGGISIVMRVELTEGARFPQTTVRQLLPMHAQVTPSALLVNTTSVDNEGVEIPSLSGANAPIATFVRESYSVGYVHLEFPVAPSQLLNGWLRFTMPLERVRNSDSHLIVRNGFPANAPMLVNARVSTLPGRGIDIRYGDVVYFDSVAHLSHVTIAEVGPRALRTNLGNRTLTNRVMGFRGNSAVTYGTGTSFPNHIAVRLTAPANYFWSPVNNHNLTVYSPNPRVIWQTGNANFLTNGTFNNVFVHDYFRPDNNRHERVVVIPNVGSNSDALIADLVGQLQLRNLVLHAGAGAPSTGPVNIDVRVGRLNPHGGATGNVCVLGQGQQVTDITLNTNLLCFCLLDTCPGTFRCTNNACSSVFENWNYPVGTYFRTLHVATRRVAGLSTDTYGESNIRSGSTVGTNFFSQTDRSGNVTARLDIIENVANALHLGPGHPVRFEFPEGVQVMEMRYRLYPTGAPGFGWTAWAQRPVEGQGTSINARFAGDNNVSIYHQLTSNRTALRTLQVEFRLSVEAGFEARFGSDLNVAISGAGVALLPEADREVTIAQVWDPITVELEGGPVLVNFVGRENNIPRTPLGNIVITETVGGALATGDHLWIYVGRELLPRPWDITLVNEGTVFTDDASGLQVRVARNHRVVSAGGETLVLQLTVTSAAHTPEYPGVITLNANEIFGIVYYDEIYNLVVSGNAVARNHSLVANQNRTGTNLITRGVFHSLPYATLLIENVDHNVGETPGFGRALSLDGVTFTTGVPFQGVANPIIWRRLPGMQHEGGFVSMRAFAYAAGIDTENITWASRVATISGFNYFGQSVVVSVSPDSNRATIVTDGIPTEVDIAMMADGLTGPYGTVRPLHEAGTIYLPLRFMFNVFGYSEFYTLVRQGQSAVITAN